MPTPVLAARQRHNALVRHHGVDDPRTREAAANLRAAKIAELIETAPSLTSEQVDRLRGLLPAPALDEAGGAVVPAGSMAQRGTAEVPPLIGTDVAQVGQAAAVIDHCDAGVGERP